MLSSSALFRLLCARLSYRRYCFASPCVCCISLQMLLERALKCQVLLKDSIACMERSSLEAAIADASSFGFGQANHVAGFDDVTAANELLARVIMCESALSSSSSTLQEADLRAAVDDAASFGYGNVNAQPPVAGVTQVEAAKVR